MISAPIIVTAVLGVFAGLGVGLWFGFQWGKKWGEADGVRWARERLEDANRQVAKNR
jgi:hypothetical protein